MHQTCSSPGKDTDDPRLDRPMRVVVTGAAGFIGSHLSESLLASGHDVVGIDGFTDYYARDAKERNLARAREHERFRFVDVDLAEDDLESALDCADVVYHLAGQPCVRAAMMQFYPYWRQHVL